MAEYAFFLQKADWWRKEMALLWWNTSIFPLLCQFQLPCHPQGELSSLNGLKAWGRDKISAMTLLFSRYGQRKKQQGLEIMVCWPYGWTLVRPGSPMEEAVGKLTACASSGHDWPYTLVQLHEAPTMHHSLRRGMWASYPSEGQRWLPVGKSAN